MCYLTVIFTILLIISPNLYLFFRDDIAKIFIKKSKPEEKKIKVIDKEIDVGRLVVRIYFETGDSIIKEFIGTANNYHGLHQTAFEHYEWWRDHAFKYGYEHEDKTYYSKIVKVEKLVKENHLVSIKMVL